MKKEFKLIDELKNYYLEDERVYKIIKEFIEIITEPLTDLTKPLKKKEYYKFIWKTAGDLKL